MNLILLKPYTKERLNIAGSKLAEFRKEEFN